MVKILNKHIGLPLLFLLLAAGCAKQSPAPPVVVPDKTVSLYNHQIKISDQTLNVQIATTSADMAEGLSDRESMAYDDGMLFDFSAGGGSASGGGNGIKPAFWMPRMHFDLDLIWINDGKIIGITPNVPAPKSLSDKLTLYYPPAMIDQVLEVNAGWSDANKIKTGDEVRLGN